jgi:Zn-dependent peptidase ImmA (M78 family)/transcriptional regulator with XRE-family HTH domain
MNRIGEVIETARRAKGWTQEELAERAGVTQAALSRYEHDLRTPEPDVLERLAKALGVTPDLLTAGARIEGGIAVTAHMRRRKTARATTWRALEARLNMARLHARHVFEEVSMQADRRVPTLDPDEISPAHAARLVRAQWRLPVGPIRGLVDWMESAGIVVIADDFGAAARVDGLSQWSEDHPVVMINSAMPVDRQRWTLAHELGHLVLHTEYIDDDAEDQADEFAAEFLMPADQIGPMLQRLRLGDLVDLKRAWGTSMAAIVERAGALGKLTPAQRSSFYKAMNAKGYRYHEPASDQLPPETPRLVQHIGQSLIAKGLTGREIAKMAGFATPEDNTLFHTVSTAPTTRGLHLVADR